MCGIIGMVRFGSSELDDKDFQNLDLAMRMLKDRGPDDQGTSQGHTWCVGHTRLAIMDPAAGRQPWHHTATKTILVYNGELYNFRELRVELEGKGHSFKTNCDTEVVLASYLEWGLNCVERFNGFFAFAIVDPNKNQLVIARDRVGVKPLYFVKTNKLFSFASNLPALLKLSRHPMQVDKEAMSHYLSTGKTTFGDQTLIKGVYALNPGHVATINLVSGELKVSRYWQRPVLSPDDKLDMPFEEASEQVRTLLEDSVKSRLMSDVPLGSFLSGGLDSSIIALNASRHSSHPIPLFAAGTEEDSTNEFEFAQEMAASLNLPLHETIITPDRFLDDWGVLIRQKGLPLSTPNEISIYNLAKALGKQCKVTLTGEGADEIFGGYIQPHFSSFDFDRCSHDPEDETPRTLFATSMALAYGRCFYINDTDHFLATNTWFTYLDKVDLFNHETWNKLEEDDAIFAFYESFFDKLSDCSSFDKRMHLHADFNLENLLNRVDTCTMAASVEARVPFTDHRLVELAFKLPDSYKMNWRSDEAKEKGKDLIAASIDRNDLLETKRLPRNAYAKHLPESIIKRKKMSFPVPFEKWFNKDLHSHLVDLCETSDITQAYFNPKTVKKLLSSKHRNLWLLANLCQWWREMNTIVHPEIPN